MRYGVLSDVHANLPALEAALGALRREGVDAYACLGDLVGYGPWPNECVRLVAGLDAVTVAGNHDLMAVGRLGAGPWVAESIAWTSGVLAGDVRRHLEGLPAVAQLRGGVVLAHGSLDSASRYLSHPADAGAELERLARERPDAALLLVGHTHASLAYGQRRGTLLYLAAGDVSLTRDERFLLNPGSVGQSRERAARAGALVLDLEAPSARFLRVPYDVAAVRRELVRQGRPPDAHHHRPPAWRSAPLRRLRRRLRERVG